MTACSCCSNRMLCGIRHHAVYWFYCTFWQEMFRDGATKVLLAATYSAVAKGFGKFKAITHSRLRKFEQNLGLIA